MGKAKIVNVCDAYGKYPIEIIKHPGRSVNRLKAIAKELADLAPKATAAEAAIETALSALSTAMDALNMAISQMKPGGKPLPVVAVAAWDNDGNGTVENCEVGTETQIGTYSLICAAVVASPASATFYLYDPYMEFIGSAVTGTAYGCSQMLFRIKMGTLPFETGDRFDIEINEANINPNVDIAKASAEAVTAQQAVTKARRLLSDLNFKKNSLLTEQAMLTSAMQTENRDAWCVDKTLTLAIGATVGTIEINGEPTQILINPGGSITGALGLLQPTGVSSKEAVFWNWAVMPGWQRWKPTYRIGTIISIDYDNNTCDIALDLAYSGVQIR